MECQRGGGGEGEGPRGRVWAWDSRESRGTSTLRLRRSSRRCNVCLPVHVCLVGAGGVLGGAESEAARACEMLEAGPRRLRPSLPSLREVRSKFRPESKAASGKRGHVPPECWRRGGSGAEGSLAALASTESSRVPRVSECPRHFPSCDPSALRPALRLPFVGRLPPGSPLFQWQCKASR